jgi:hypothetical protein
MSERHVVGRRSVLRGLAVGLLGASAGCGEGGSRPASDTEKKRGEEVKQRKLDSMKEKTQKQQGGKRSP